VKNPLLMVGGLAMCSDEFEPVASCLRHQESEIFYFDNPCVGQGPRCFEKLSIGDQAKHQWDEVDRVPALNGRKLDIFGLSMGGMIAAEMVAMFPERVGSLIVAATSPNIAPTTEAFSDELEAKFLNVKSVEQLQAAVDIAFGRTCLSKHADIRDAYFNYRASGANGQKHKDFSLQLSAIRSFKGADIYSRIRNSGIRSLVIAGEEDQLFPLKHSNKIGEILDVPVRILPNVGHMIHLEAREQLAQIILDI